MLYVVSAELQELLDNFYVLTGIKVAVNDCDITFGVVSHSNDFCDTITQIAANVGYTDYNYFAKVFRKHYGINPSEYRRKIVTAVDEQYRITEDIQHH